MGLVGIPVFAEGGGPGYVAQPTFGYLVGFFLQAGMNGWLVRRGADIRLMPVLAANLAGMVVVYLFGMVYFYIASNYIIHAPIAVWPVIWYCGILQAPADLLLCIAAAMIGVRCYHAGLWLAMGNKSQVGTIKTREA